MDVQGHFQGQVWWGFEQPGLEEDVLAQGKETELDYPRMSFPI